MLPASCYCLRVSLVHVISHNLPLPSRCSFTLPLCCSTNAVSSFCLTMPPLGHQLLHSLPCTSSDFLAAYHSPCPTLLDCIGHMVSSLSAVSMSPPPLSPHRLFHCATPAAWRRSRPFPPAHLPPLAVISIQRRSDIRWSFQFPHYSKYGGTS